MGENQQYLVLARKYRPTTFEDLKGQDALVQTLSNAIKSNRLHHAYILTGIRGVGKTTTARIIAKALNCENGPSITWDEEKDPQVKAITVGNHVDVLEFDAASHRGVEEISDLFEGVAYAPVQGRRKVYIIDEVHMLSKHAFNALLKTLEEPPSHVTFIFATTEVNKVPVTVLSRCQRFDLKRIKVDVLADLYQSILDKEGIKIEPEALQLIAKAADGSARDGQSLLDQAIALSGVKKIKTDVVNDMLGLADRAQTMKLIDVLLQGDAAQSLKIMDSLYELGQDPILLVTECMRVVDTLTRLKIVKGLADSKNITEMERTNLVPLAQKVPLENLSRLYQMLLQALTESKQADRPFEVVCMAMVRIAHLAALPSIEILLKAAPAVENSASAQHIEPAPQEEVQPPSKKPNPAPKKVTNWPEIVSLVKQQKPALGAIMSQQVRCISVEGTVLEVFIENGLQKPEEIRKCMQTILRQATKDMWEVKLSKEKIKTETLAETKIREKGEKVASAKEDDAVKKAMAMFPGAQVVDVKEN